MRLSRRPPATTIPADENGASESSLGDLTPEIQEAILDALCAAQERGAADSYQ